MHMHQQGSEKSILTQPAICCGCAADAINLGEVTRRDRSNMQ
jgi:hypothetical protein